MRNVPGLVGMLAREWLSSPRLERRPEPTALMEDAASVEAFHLQGAADGPLAAVYHFNALATSRLVPEGGTVVDLGSGSGQYLAYLAARRPDLHVVGFDLSRAMVAHGQRFLSAAGLGDRVDLKVGDMTDFLAQVTGPVDAVSTVFALHHLPTADHVRRCLAQFATLRERTGCAVWIFDHARPRHPGTPEVFTAIFTPDAPSAFNVDSRNSLIASFSFAELSALVDGAGLAPAEHHLSRMLRLYQVHRVPGAKASGDAGRRWTEGTLSSGARRDFDGLRNLFPKLALE